MKNIRVILTVIFITLISSHGLAQVVGNTSDGSTIVITGSGFGTHDLSGGMIGKKNGIVHSTSNGQRLPSNSKWINGDDNVRAPLYVANNNHSRVAGENVITGKTDNSRGHFNAPLIYDHGSPIGAGEKIFFTYWTKMLCEEANDGQWKMWRLSNTNNISDHLGEITYFNWDRSDSLSIRNSWTGVSTTRTVSWVQSALNPDGARAYLPEHGVGEWSRVEVQVLTSDYDLVNGEVHLIAHRNDFSGPPYDLRHRNYENGWTWPETLTYTNDSERFRYVILQNYIGNGDYNSINSKDVFMEDVYVQVGTYKRVELCESSDWNSCAHREIQFPTSWSDNAIELELNHGSFTSGSIAYLHVIGENNQSLSNYAITLSGNSSSNAPPRAPTSLQLEVVE
ncbi:MAG: hypothetical protein K6L76_02755 [Agarilytica sp.]